MKFYEDKKIIGLGVILVLFTVVYFVVANKLSYAFSDGLDKEAMYNDTIEIITKSAIAYGNDNIDLIKESENNTIYPKVQDLIDNGYLVADENGNIVNPINNNKILNSYGLKIKYADGKISAEVNSN